MDQDKHKAAMSAISDLIRSQLEGEDRTRFASVKRLAVIGQKLMTELRPNAGRAMTTDEERRVQVHVNEFLGGSIGGPPTRAQLERAYRDIRIELATTVRAIGELRTERDELCARLAAATVKFPVCTCGANIGCAGLYGPPPHKPDCAAFPKVAGGAGSVGPRLDTDYG